jgi:hypothetical protein
LGGQEVYPAVPFGFWKEKHLVDKRQRTHRSVAPPKASSAIFLGHDSSHDRSKLYGISGHQNMVDKQRQKHTMTPI